VAELCSLRVTLRKTECLTKKQIVDIINDRLAKRTDPFGTGMRVLITEEPGFGSWRTATIQRQYSDGDPESSQGYKWRVALAGGGTKELPEEAVLATCRGGLPAVLRVAAETGDTYLASLLVRDVRVNLYETDEAANTALLIAAKSGQDEVCRILLESKQGRATHDEETKKRLKSKGFKELRNTLRQNAYDLAVSRRDVESFKTVRELLPSRSDRLLKEFKEVDLKSSQALSDVAALEHALATLTQGGEGHEGGEAGATPVCIDEHAETPLGKGVTPLMLACRHGITDAVHRLIAAKASVNAVTAGNDPCTALGMASEQGHLEIVKMLLFANADANELWDEQNPTKRPPLLLAAQGGRYEVVAALIASKADVNTSRDRRTVLMHACQYGYSKTAKLLIDGRADINAVNATERGGHAHAGHMRRETALMFASRYGQTSCVRLLLEKNINVIDAEVPAPLPRPLLVATPSTPAKSQAHIGDVSRGGLTSSACTADQPSSVGLAAPRMRQRLLGRATRSLDPMRPHGPHPHSPRRARPHPHSPRRAGSSLGPHPHTSRAPAAPRHGPFLDSLRSRTRCLRSTSSSSTCRTSRRAAPLR
jgi:ankyrin repeat protein